MAKGDEKDPTPSDKYIDALKKRPTGAAGRRPPTRHTRGHVDENPTDSVVAKEGKRPPHKESDQTKENPTDDLTKRQLEFLQSIHREIKQKDWQLGKLGGMEVRVDNQTKLMPHNAARIYELSSQADSHNLPAVKGLFMQVSQILAETQKEPWWKKVLDKLDFLNLFARSNDTSAFYKKSHDTFFKSEEPVKAKEEPEHSAESVKGLPP